jgi:peptidoglycan hydrolase-like protein with peptidoglycan-binding domain
MGMRTKEAIKSFQNASSLPVTGTLDAATSQQLGIGGSGSGMSKSSRNDTPSSNTTVGKDTDQPNLPAKGK